MLSLAALVPGLVGWLHGVVAAGTDIGDWHQSLLAELEDIRFGSGLRFWLGVTGATMMGLLLLYPLRKAFAQRFRLGGVGAWFHIHIIFGLLGPVLILYHCNFGFGSFNANVALVTMLAVAASGIIGQFVYMRASAGFYGDKQKVRGHLDAVIAELKALDASESATTALIGRLEAFEKELLTPRNGVAQSVLGSLRVEVRRRQFFRDASALLADAQRRYSWPQPQYQQRRRLVGAHLAAYVSMARRAAGRSIREQLWARWRLFHLPLFLIMTVATVLHVYAVWDMDGPGDQQRAAQGAVAGTAADGTATRTKSTTPAAPRSSGIIQQQIRKTVTVAGNSASTPGTASAEQGNAPPPGPAPRVPEPKRPDAEGLTALIEQQKEPETTKPAHKALPEAKPTPPKLVDTPKLAEAPKPATRPVADPATGVQPKVAEAAPKTAPAPIRPKVDDAFRPPVQAAQPPAEPMVAAAKPAPVKPDDPAPLYAELTKRTEEQPPMSLGASKATTLKERIAELQAQRFDHNKTHFPLTGKHTKVACENCHTKTLENTPKECIACHKKDDVHRGRRPDCADCHTPNNWGQNKKKR